MDVEIRRSSWRERQAKTRDKRRRLLFQFKARPCADCGQSFDPVCMDWDHRPGCGKKFNISKSCLNQDLMKLLDEIVKCDLVCANCHRLRTKLRALN